MKPIGPLMIEHRLIERMVKILKDETEREREEGVVDVDLIMKGVDFFRTYADRTHHGKEEDILFRDLGKKKLDPELKDKMDRLVEEHVFARGKVKELIDAVKAYESGQKDKIDDVTDILSVLIEFYPKHIELEDKNFFYPCQEYFTREENDRMLKEYMEFDSKMIHERYENIVEDLERSNR